MRFQCRRIVARCSRRSGHANGIIAASATHQRMNVSAKGVTWPAMARPITQLRDQKSAVRLRSRYGEAWNEAARRGIEGNCSGRGVIIRRWYARPLPEKDRDG